MPISDKFMSILKRQLKSDFEKTFERISKNTDWDAVAKIYSEDGVMGIVERLRSGHVRYGIESEQDAAKRWIKERREAADEIERLREALEKIATQDTPRSEGEKYRDDGKYSKLDKCKHGLFMYEDCDQCISDFARSALKESE